MTRQITTAPAALDEPRLWRAVFHQALEDLASADPDERSDALAWTVSGDAAVGSLRWIATVLELDQHALAATRLVGRGLGARYQRTLGAITPACFFCDAPISADRLYCDRRCRKQAEWRLRRQRRRAAA